MSLRPATRVALHLLLIVAMIVPALAPVRAIATEAEPAAISESVATMDMPCHDAMAMAMAEHGDQSSSPAPAPVGDPPCDKGCCPELTCDMSACLATGCLLPQFAGIPGAMPAMTFSFPWRTRVSPARMLDTPLRPPIA